jgi:hypothetical protein
MRPLGTTDLEYENHDQEIWSYGPFFAANWEFSVKP